MEAQLGANIKRLLADIDDNTLDQILSTKPHNKHSKQKALKQEPGTDPEKKNKSL